MLKNKRKGKETFHKRKKRERNIETVRLTEGENWDDYTGEYGDNYPVDEAMDNLSNAMSEKEKKRLKGLRIISAPKEPKPYYEEELEEDTSNNMAFPFHDDEKPNEESDPQYKEKKQQAEQKIDKVKKSKHSREKTAKLIGIALSAIWIGLAVGYYIRSIDQIGVLFMMPPHIVGVSITGLIAPLILLWFTISQAYGRRDRNRQQDIQALPTESYTHDFLPSDFPSRENLYLFHKDVETFCVQAAELSAYSKAMAQTIPEARERLKEDVRLFLEFSDKTAESVENISKILIERTDRFVEVIDELEDRSGHMNKEMHDGIQRNYETAKDVSGEIERIAMDIQNIQRAAQDLHSDIQSSNKELSGEAERIADISLKASKVIQQASGSLASQSENLLKTIDGVNNAPEPEPREVHRPTSLYEEEASLRVRPQRQDPISIPKKSARTPHFSDALSARSGRGDTSYSLDGMHSIAVDLTRSIDGKIRESLWELYQNGDREAFTQYLISVEDKLLAAKSFKMFKNDAEFRSYVQNFIQQFESLYEELYEKSEEDESGSLLPSLILNSNLGRLYKILCRLSGQPMISV